MKRISKRLTYKQSGVDIAKADRFIKKIIPFARQTAINGTLGGIGGFSGAFRLPKGLKEPVMVSATDGIGTKLLLARLRGRYDTIGIDLVAMCVNDLITSGARPLFFLDYLASSAIDMTCSVNLIKGIAKGCRQAQCTLIGGETAEMPGLYQKGDFDLAGFAVGVVERKKMIDGKNISPGDCLIGLKSSGLHSNGYSLARKCFTKSELKGSLGQTLLRPTHIYVKPVLALLRKIKLKGLAHITGGGFYGNVPRIFARQNIDARIDLKSWKVPTIFDIIAKRAHLTQREMFTTFNMGIGMVIVVSKKDLAFAESVLKKQRTPYNIIGTISKGKGNCIL